LRASSAGVEAETHLPSPEQASPEWKREANRRLAIHRARRNDRAQLQSALPGMEEAVEPALLAKNRSVADRVAERYAKAPTYSEMLAHEARNAARAAEAAAVAAGEARNAAQAILVGLDVDFDGVDFDAESEHDTELPSPTVNTQADRWSAPSQTAHVASPVVETKAQARAGSLITEVTDEDDDEEPIAPVQPLPAKLIEFPRELVAVRKARPRLAEGPLREEYDRESTASQLRIFEVEHESISTAPVVAAVHADWSPIRLDPSPALPVHDWISRHPESAPLPIESARVSTAGLELPLQTAPLEDRLMAGLVDAALILGGFLVFVLVFVACTVHPPMGKPAMVGAAVALCAFAAIYLLLFFNFGTDTPGMRYAKIALCTFDDENPTRNAMRRRLAALLLAVIPMGIGILWAFFDDDRLGWHDRISRTYQRSYR
jgi:uncharacterized RDD family membrane protein YckC